MKHNCIVLILLFIINLCVGWESYELDLFDLVEELNTNFYQFIGVEPTSEVSDIKRAYRKLSLQWHPDKSNEADAEIKFRHLVSVYEVLKDDIKRKRYDRILTEGLPKWNTPVYYYRRVRKLHVWEMFLLLSVILTIGHYFVLWAIYFEKRLTMDERLVDMRKRLEKKMKKTTKQKDINQDMIDEELSKMVPILPKPVWRDILPVQFIKYFFIQNKCFLPAIIQLCNRKQTINIDDNDELKIEPQPRSPKIIIDDIVPEMASSQNKPVHSYNIESQNDLSNYVPLSSTANDNLPWTDEEKMLLCKSVARYPGGTPNRWEKISEMVGRNVNQVVEMAKHIKTNVTNVSTTGQNRTLPSSTLIADEIITEREDDDTSDDTSRSRKTAAKVDQEWSQTDQRLLECALKQIPKEINDRWGKIAECVPGKTKDDCLARYKVIVQMVKAKKTS
ncbi:unnamed protein product [Didymodactylos carnosus]|uniref:DnaJ-like protein n=1 Tax=Didymodactylos carnosus TaxID=1234261 RepID=A0A814MRD7_9BILA|nr:unnamed protein product [Didymodactylos carnosus]CAF3848524.1 unnamed protein product [Didymodactylos carnosus]